MNMISALLRTLTEPAKPAEVAMSEHGEFLDYAERASSETLEDLRAAFNSHFERSVKMLTLLTGGSGAVAVYTMNNWEKLDLDGRMPLLLFGVGWSVSAIGLALRGMRSRKMGSGCSLIEMAKTYSEHAGNTAQPQRAEIAAGALLTLRRAELNRRHLQIEEYAKAVSEQTENMRDAVILAAMTPALALAWQFIAAFVT